MAPPLPLPVTAPEPVAGLELLLELPEPLPEVSAAEPAAGPLGVVVVPPEELPLLGLLVEEELPDVP